MAHVTDTDPYPWPFDGRTDGEHLALVVAGAQAHWVARSTDATRALVALTELAEVVQRAGGQVVALRHGRAEPLATSGRRPPLPTVGSEGWSTCLGGLRPDHVVDAGGLNGFHDSALDALLVGLGRTHLLLGGFAAEITVDSTLRSANDRGYECLVLADACAFVDPRLGEHALSSVTMSGGIFGAVGTSAAVRRALTEPRSVRPPATLPPPLAAAAPEPLEQR